MGDMTEFIEWLDQSIEDDEMRSHIYMLIEYKNIAIEALKQVQVDVDKKGTMTAMANLKKALKKLGEA